MRRAVAAAILAPSTCIIDEAWTAPSAARQAAPASAAGAGGGARGAQGAATPDLVRESSAPPAAPRPPPTSALRLLLCIGAPFQRTLGRHAGSTDGYPAGATGEGSPLPLRSAASRVRVTGRFGARAVRPPMATRPRSGRSRCWPAGRPGCWCRPGGPCPPLPEGAGGGAVALGSLLSSAFLVSLSYDRNQLDQLEEYLCDLGAAELLLPCQ